MDYINSWEFGSRYFLRTGSFSKREPIEIKWNIKIKRLLASMDGTKAQGSRSFKYRVRTLDLLPE